jgi:tRNA nucleotidyltransferase (CCA-adding enzyme)
VFRAVRFEARLGFRMEPHTEALARRAAAGGAFAPLSGSRLRHELELLMECAEGGESLALAGLERLDELGVLAAIHPGLHLDDEVRGLVRRAVAVHAWYVSVGASGPPARLGLLLLLALASTVDGGELARRLLLVGQEERLLIEGAARVRVAGAALAAARAAHEVDEILAPLAGEELLLVAAQEGTRGWVRRYLLEMRPLTLAIRGADLLTAGAARGPRVGSALRTTRAARLDGLISADEELAFALAELKRRVD